MSPRRIPFARTGKPHEVGETSQRPSNSRIFSDEAWAEIARSLKLSGRELQIARGVFDDRIELAIASDLGISSHTVHTHIERLHHKLAVRNRVEMVLRLTNEFLALTARPGSSMPPICANWTSGRCPVRRQ